MVGKFGPLNPRVGRSSAPTPELRVHLNPRWHPEMRQGAQSGKSNWRTPSGESAPVGEVTLINRSLRQPHLGAVRKRQLSRHDRDLGVGSLQDQFTAI